MGIPRGESPETCTAGAGTLLLEFGLLSRLTGNPVYMVKSKTYWHPLMLCRTQPEELWLSFGNEGQVFRWLEMLSMSKTVMWSISFLSLNSVQDNGSAQTAVLVRALTHFSSTCWKLTFFSAIKKCTMYLFKYVFRANVIVNLMTNFRRTTLWKNTRRKGNGTFLCICQPGKLFVSG